MGIRPAYYIITPITEIYRLYKKAQDENYPLFSKNIREWLGDNPINKGIINTLKSEEENENFLYYNNGITMIYEEAEASHLDDTKRVIPLINPQIVNGCQTTNSIFQVLSKCKEEDIKERFSKAYVLVKALLKKSDDDNIFYEKVIKYTNKQNSIPDKIFAANDSYSYFARIQKELKERGFLLGIKPSDKETFKQSYSSKKALQEILDIANKRAAIFNIDLKNLKDIIIPLEKLLQITLAFVQDGHAAYTKKSCVLKFGHPIYQNFSSCLLDHLTTDSALNIYLLYQKAEIERKSSDRRNPIPYYLISFLGDYFKNKKAENMENLANFFNDKTNIEDAYTWLKDITTGYHDMYTKRHKEDYNRMIKQKIDEDLLKEIKDNFIKWGKREDPILRIIQS